MLTGSALTATKGNEMHHRLAVCPGWWRRSQSLPCRLPATFSVLLSIC